MLWFAFLFSLTFMQALFVIFFFFFVAGIWYSILKSVTKISVVVNVSS